MAAKILVIEDDEAILGFLRRGLGYEGYEVETADTGQKGLALAGGNRHERRSDGRFRALHRVGHTRARP